MIAVDTAVPKPTLDEARLDLDASIEVLKKHKDAWLDVPIERKIDYLLAIAERTLESAPEQVAAAAEAKGLAPDSPMVGEEWIAGPYIQIKAARQLAASLQKIRQHGTVPIPEKRIRVRPDGQLAVSVFPANVFDRLLYQGFRAEVWMDSSVHPENLQKTIGGALVRRPASGKVGLVLGAGNVASIAPLDVLNKLIFEGQVVLVKFNPVNDYLGPFVERVFFDLIQDGFLRTAYGGGDIGAYLCDHPDIDEIHITGSARTHDLIVFGGGSEGAERKARNEPRLGKRITSELGNVSPMIVVPGDWSESDLQFQAENVATQMTQNGGFNCNATKVLVTHASWPQRRAFLDRLRTVLAGLPDRPAYYPGAHERLERFKSAYPQAEVLKADRPGAVQPTLIPDLEPSDAERLAFEEESFCALAAETPLTASSPAEFLTKAVVFCNDELEGTLNAGLLVDPKTGKALGPALEEAIAALRYGSVAVNHWPALSYGLCSTTWGAFPGHTLDDIQSGLGTVHNTMLFERPEKSVIWGPFRVFPKPPWFVTHKNAHKVGEKITELEAKPVLWSLPGVVASAIRG